MGQITKTFLLLSMLLICLNVTGQNRNNDILSDTTKFAEDMKNTNSNEIPKWASFFEYKEYSTFMCEIDNYFRSLNIEYELGDGQIDVQPNDFGFNTLGLINVAQICKQEEKEFYKEVITEHFNSMIKANNFEKEFEKIADNFEEVKKYIGVRLYDNGYVEYVGKENTIGKDFAGNIYSMIVFDFPYSVSSIKPEQTIAWNKTIDELFEIGISNIKSKYPPIVTKEDIGDCKIWFIQGDHFFIPNIVFDIENRKELIGSKGSLIGLPDRHSAIIYPIEDLEVLNAINRLIPIIYGMSQKGPGSLSDNLFWYKDNTFTQLPYKLDENKLNFFPPDSFVEFLNELK